MYQAKGLTNAMSSIVVEPHEDGGVQVKVIEKNRGYVRRSDIVLSKEDTSRLILEIDVYLYAHGPVGDVPEPTPGHTPPE